MFTKEDYQNYFDALREKEKEMMNFMDKAIPLFKDRKVINILNIIKNDEIKHKNLIDELLKYTKDIN